MIILIKFYFKEQNRCESWRKFRRNPSFEASLALRSNLSEQNVSLICIFTAPLKQLHISETYLFSLVAANMDGMIFEPRPLHRSQKIQRGKK